MKTTRQPRQSSDQTYLSYVSPLLLRRLGMPAESLVVPDVESVSGAVVLLDVERFSAFAERMSERGSEGVEQLSIKINQTFALVVEAIERYGGIAQSFPGDSVIALWLAESRSTEEAALLAARSALELLDAHRDSELPLKAGLAVGEMNIVHVGGVDQRRQLLLSGDPLDQMGRAEERSSRGRLIVAESAWQLLSPHAVAAVDAHGFFELKSLRSAAPPASGSLPDYRRASTELVDAARAYLPSVLLRQLDAGLSAWLGEFREVTCLFIQVRTESQTFSQVQVAFCEMQRAIYRHGGDIMRFGHDDKGLGVLAVVGLPPGSSESSAARGVAAALDIQSTAPHHNFRCRIGVASGRVFCGTLGAPRRREFSIVGSTPNMAARLMQSSESGILCDRATTEAATPSHRFEGAGRLRPKGFHDAIEVFRPVVASSLPSPRRPHPSPAVALFGRSQEILQLRRWLATLHDGKTSLETNTTPPPETATGARLALVQGEAGVGKSALLRNTLEYAREIGRTPIIVGCEAVQSSSTYAAWAKVLCELLNLDSLRDPAARTSHVLTALEEAVVDRELAPLLAPILGIKVDENQTTRDMSGAARGDNLLAVMLRLLTSLAGKRGEGLFVVLEDVHWMDATSWQLLGVLARSSEEHGLRVLLTLRSETTPNGSDWHNVVSGAGVEHVSLTPLSLTETRSLVLHLLQAEDLSQQLLTITYERTRGNPFFCEQLVSALLESGIVSVEAGVASLRIRNPEQAENLVPRSVAAVVTSRLDRLPAPVQLTLKAASVVGARFRLDVLHAIHPMGLDEDTLLDHLSSATELGLVEKDPASPDSQRFRHALTCDVAYDMLLVTQHRQLHREVAEYLSQESESPAARSLLFYHWRRSGDRKRALRHVDHAGAEAMRNGNYHAVTEFYGYALKTIADHPEETPPPPAFGVPARQAMWSGNLGEAQVAIGLHEAARPNLELCLQTLGETAPGKPLDLALAIGREALRQLSHRLARKRTEGSRHAESAALALAAQTYEQLGFVYYSAGETARGLHAALRILNLCELAGLANLMARSYGVMSLTASVVRLRRLAALYDRRAVRISRETDDVLAQAYVGWVTGVRAAGEADWGLVTMRVEAACKAAEDAGDLRLRIMSLQLLVWPAYVRGDFSRANELGEAQLAIARESNNRLWEAWGLNSLSETAVMVGDYDVAIRNCRRALSVFSEESDKAEELRAIGLLAVSLFRRGRSDEALSLTHRGLEQMSTMELTSLSTYEGFAGVCEVLLALGEETRRRTQALPPTLARDIKRAGDAMARFSRTFPLGRPRLHCIRARTAALGGERDAVVREFNHSLRAADDLGMAHEKGLTLVAAAKCEPLDAAARRRRAEEAIGVLRSGEALREAQAILEQMQA